MTPRWRVHMDIDPRMEMVYPSFVYTGLFELASTGEVDLSLRWRPYLDHFANVIDVECLRESSSRRLVFDIHDRSYDFSEAGLQTGDFYFKRCFHQPDVDHLPEPLRAKVRPFGPIFAPGAPQARVRLIMGALTHAVPSKHAREAASNLRAYFGLPSLAAYSCPPDLERPARVLLQTRLWTDKEVTGTPSAADINQERVALVRALRNALGDQHAGGIVDTPVARELCPDLVCSHDTRRDAYIATMHQCRVGIYTRGLHESTAWKLGEYLASSLCIVSDGLRNTLTPPLEEGRHILTYSEPEECVAHCRRLLDDADFAYAMATANAQYYREHASPPANLKRCFDVAFASEPTR